MTLFTVVTGPTTSAAARPLVLIHGWTCDHTAMAPVAEAFPDRRCISVDLLGHGRSPASGCYAIRTQAEAVLTAAPDGAILVGHSMGAQIAVEAAAQAPDRIAGVVMLDPAPIVPHESAITYCEDMRRQLARLSDEQIPDMLAVFGRRQIIKASDIAVVERNVEIMVKTPPAVVRACWDAICDWNGPERFAQLTCPSLTIVIDKALNRPANIAKANRKAMTGQVAGAGHMIQFEAMDQVAAMMRRFLSLQQL